MHYRNGWDSVFCITMKLLFIRLYFHAALNVLTALILLSSSRISDKNYLIQWKFETISATDVPKFSLKSTDVPPFIQWGRVWRISWKKILFQIWTGESYTSISVNIKNHGTDFQLWVFKLCWLLVLQACTDCKQLNLPEKILASMYLIRSIHHFLFAPLYSWFMLRWWHEERIFKILLWGFYYSIFQDISMIKLTGDLK